MARLIIAGSRSLSVLDQHGSRHNPGWSPFEMDRRLTRLLFRRIERGIGALGLTGQIDEEVCGKARGVDRYGELWAKGRSIAVVPYPPRYDDYPVGEHRRAPLDRNIAMARYAAQTPGGALIVIPLDGSTGSAHMEAQARLLGLAVWSDPIDTATLWRELARDARFLGMAPPHSSPGDSSLF